MGLLVSAVYPSEMILLIEHWWVFFVGLLALAFASGAQKWPSIGQRLAENGGCGPLKPHSADVSGCGWYLQDQPVDFFISLCAFLCFFLSGVLSMAGDFSLICGGSPGVGLGVVGDRSMTNMEQFCTIPKVFLFGLGLVGTILHPLIYVWRLRGAQLGDTGTLIAESAGILIFLIVMYNWRFTIDDMLYDPRPSQQTWMLGLLDIGSIGLLVMLLLRLFYARKYGGLTPRMFCSAIFCLSVGEAGPGGFDFVAFEHAFFRLPTVENQEGTVDAEAGDEHVSGEAAAQDGIEEAVLPASAAADSHGATVVAP